MSGVDQRALKHRQHNSDERPGGAFSPVSCLQLSIAPYSSAQLILRGPYVPVDVWSNTATNCSKESEIRTPAVNVNLAQKKV